MSRLEEELVERARYVLKTRGKRSGFVSYFSDEIIGIESVESKPTDFRIYVESDGSSVECYLESEGCSELNTFYCSDLQAKAVRRLREIMLLDDLARGHEPPPDSILETLRDE